MIYKTSPSPLFTPLAISLLIDFRKRTFKSMCIKSSILKYLPTRGSLYERSRGKFSKKKKNILLSCRLRIIRIINVEFPCFFKQYFRDSTFFFQYVINIYRSGCIMVIFHGCSRTRSCVKITENRREIA